MTGQSVQDSDLPNAVVGRWVVLRPPSAADYPAFFRWRTNLLELHLWASSKRVPTYEEFVSEMEHLLHQSITFVVAERKDAAPIGFVQAYNLNLPEGWCFTLAYMLPQFRRGHGAEAYIHLVDYLFRSFALRKIYVDVYEFNLEMMMPLMRRGLIEEGRLRAHTWFNDRYWDVIRLAMYRDDWNSFRQQTHFLLGVQQETEQILEEQVARVDGHA